jgi:hypothetical protein
MTAAANFSTSSFAFPSLFIGLKRPTTTNVVDVFAAVVPQIWCKN